MAVGRKRSTYAEMCTCGPQVDFDCFTEKQGISKNSDSSSSQMNLSPYVINHKLFLMQILQCEIISISTTVKSLRKLKQNTVQLLQVCLTLQIILFFFGCTNSLQYLSSPTRDQTHAPCLERGNLNH